MGVAALGTLRLSAWAAPEPVSAAPAQVEPAPTSVSDAAPPSQPAVVTPEPTPTAEQDDVSPVADPVEPTAVVSEPVATSPTEYTVVAGDTLARVASEHGLSVADMIAVNELADPDLLHVGQSLIIPASDQSSEPAASAAPEGSQSLLPEPEIMPVDPPADLRAGDRWIDVDLSEQRLTAYEGSSAVRTTLVSTGLPQTPTPIGQYRIWIKLRYDDMAGPGYYIEDVPFVMYFHEGYGLHGVTWHGNFGHPMSHGCVNLPTVEAEWIFNWAEVGTLVNVHA
jgi:lipoprotein-anchoring transpeptidase ErfK/SrfK